MLQQIERTECTTRDELLGILHWLMGFEESCPKGVEDFVDFHSLLANWRLWTGKKSIRKSVAVAQFLELNPLERRQVIMSRPELIPLLPRDVKLLLNAKQVPEELRSVGSRSFNPGRQIQFDVYGIFDVLKQIKV